MRGNEKCSLWTNYLIESTLEYVKQEDESEMQLRIFQGYLLWFIEVRMGDGALYQVYLLDIPSFLFALILDKLFEIFPSLNCCWTLKRPNIAKIIWVKTKRKLPECRSSNDTTQLWRKRLNPTSKTIITRCCETNFNSTWSFSSISVSNVKH